MTSTIAKNDKDKTRFDLIEPGFLFELAEVLTEGEKSHKGHSWKDLENARSRYTAAAHRHLNAWQRGEKFDETGSHHLINVVANLMFLHYEDTSENSKL